MKNLIYIVTDTLRADYIGAYGNTFIRTPRLDAFARRCVRFTKAHGEGLPTIPARRVFMTGREILPFDDTPPYKGVDPDLAGWRALSEEDVTLADYLRDKGYYNGLVSDLWHLFKPNMNFWRNFDTWDFIRGQERDQWIRGPKNKFNLFDYVPKHLIEKDMKKANAFLETYLQNTDWFRGEEDYFFARTVRSAIKWLENCRDRAPFHLYIDTFDPHEVFDPPKQYAAMYYDKYPMERPLYGYGVDQAAITEEDRKWIHGLYCGKVTFVDTWFGYLLDAVERLGLMEDTVICFTSDHGTEFYEHGHICKAESRLYETVTRIPLLLYVPGMDTKAGQAIDSLVSMVDIAPSLLRLMGVEPHERMTGRDLGKLIRGEAKEIRDHLVTGYGRSGAVRTHEWLFHCHAQPECKHSRGEKPATRQLFDLRKDPGEHINVHAQHPDVAAKMHAWAREVWPNAV